MMGDFFRLLYFSMTSSCAQNSRSLILMSGAVVEIGVLMLASEFQVCWLNREGSKCVVFFIFILKEFTNARMSVRIHA